MSEIEVKSTDGIDILRYQPEGVCSKLMQVKIKDSIILDFEAVGGCSGNLHGIGMLIKGMNINDVVSRLQGLPCGSRATSCPDQLSKALQLYISEKQSVHA